MMPDKHLMLLDGNNLVMRAYFAMAHSRGGSLATKAGVPSGALHGVLTSFRGYMRDVNPSHVLWLFDQGKSDMRVKLQPDYKGHRKTSAASDGTVPNPAEDLPPQYEGLRNFLDIFGIRHYSESGVEADDLIAQAVHTLSPYFDSTTIVTSDHDLLQLVRDASPCVRVFRPGEAPKTVVGGVGLAGQMKRSVVSGVTYTEREVHDKYGLPPWDLSKMWALTGDTGDNIKGIHGIGPKTAAKWVRKYGQLNEVLVREDKCLGHERLCWNNFQMIHLDGTVGHLDQAVAHPEDLALVRNEEVDHHSLVNFLERWELNQLSAMLHEGL